MERFLVRRIISIIMTVMLTAMMMTAAARGHAAASGTVVL